MKKRLVYLIILFMSCSSERDEQVNSKLKFSENLSSNIAEGRHIADSIINGSINHADEDGTRLKFKAKEGKINSSFEVFYPSGNPKAILNFRSGDFGVASHVEYYEEEISYFIRDENDTLEVTEPKIKNYYYTNHEGEIIYKRQYNDSGLVIKSEGRLIATTRVIEKLMFDIGEPVDIQYYLVAEPYPMFQDIRRSFSVKIYHEGTLIKQFASEINNSCSCVLVNEKFKEPGNYKFEAVARYEDISSNYDGDKVIDTMFDTAQFEITVKEK